MNDPNGPGDEPGGIKPDRKPQELGRTQRPFDETTAAHTVVRAAEDMDWDLTDPEAFRRRIQHVEYGLSAEIEFAALLRWLGTCAFVHRLSENAFTDPSRAVWQVPDLFAVFSVGEETSSALIEVKTTKDHVLKLKKSYLERLRAYARLLNQPLLIAWRPRAINFWLLVDRDVIEDPPERVFIFLCVIHNKPLLDVIQHEHDQVTRDLTPPPAEVEHVFPLCVLEPPSKKPLVLQ